MAQNQTRPTTANSHPRRFYYYPSFKLLVGGRLDFNEEYACIVMQNLRTLFIDGGRFFVSYLLFTGKVFHVLPGRPRSRMASMHPVGPDCGAKVLGCAHGQQGTIRVSRLEAKNPLRPPNAISKQQVGYRSFKALTRGSRVL